MISAGENGSDILRRAVPEAVSHLCDKIPTPRQFKGMPVECPKEIELAVRNTCVAELEPEKMRQCLGELKGVILGHKAQVGGGERNQQTGLTLDLSNESYAASKGRGGLQAQLEGLKAKYPPIPPVPAFPGADGVRAMVASNTLALAGFNEIAKACDGITWDYAKGLCQRGVEDILKQIWVALEGKPDRLILFFQNNSAALKASLGDRDPEIKVTIGRGYPVGVPVSRAFDYIKIELARAAEEQAKKEKAPPAPPPAPKQCADGVDNDGDGKIDFKAPSGKDDDKDPNCDSADDDSEKAPEKKSKNAFSMVLEGGIGLAGLDVGTLSPTGNGGGDLGRTEPNDEDYNSGGGGGGGDADTDGGSSNTSINTLHPEGGLQLRYFGTDEGGEDGLLLGGRGIYKFLDAENDDISAFGKSGNFHAVTGALLVGYRWSGKHEAIGFAGVHLAFPTDDVHRGKKAGSKDYTSYDAAVGAAYAYAIVDFEKFLWGTAQLRLAAELEGVIGMPSWNKHKVDGKQNEGYGLEGATLSLKLQLATF